ncbi:MAG: hypothetical protein ACI4VG_04545 [Lachnospiraceae bacterium]
MEEVQNGQPQTQIPLQPQAARQRQEVYGSLTDLHQIDLFTDEFRVILQEGKENKQQEEGKRRQLIFGENELQTEGRDDRLIRQLFLKSESRIPSQSYEQTKNRLTFQETAFVLFALMAVSALYLFFFTHKQKEKKAV